MKSEEVMLDGKKIKIITELEKDDMDDTILTEEDLDKTVELTDAINQINEAGEMNYE